MNKVPVLSNKIALTLLIFSKIEFFLIKILFFIARFNVITMTEGIARPKAHGQLATSIEIDLSKGKHHLQY